jgi:mono/diheme cytochrome c family protein
MLNTLTRQLLPLSALAFAFALVGPSPAAAQDAARGAEVYAAQKCSTCHAIAGKGKAANPLDGVGAKLSAADIKEWIIHPKEMTAKTGSTKKPVMPAKYSNLPAADLDALVAYLASLK